MRVQHFVGLDNIPRGCHKLTLRWGLMQVWLRESDDIQASVIFDDNESCVAWAAYIPSKNLYDNHILNSAVNIGVFTAPVHRGKGLGKLVLRHALYFIAMQNPHATVRYGSMECRAFNDTYRREVERIGLTPDHSF